MIDDNFLNFISLYLFKDPLPMRVNNCRYSLLYSSINSLPHSSTDSTTDDIKNPITEGITLNSNLGPDGKTPLSDYISQALVGFLLGDGTLVKKYTGGGTYFKYSQSIEHSEYLFFVFNLFKD